MADEKRASSSDGSHKAEAVLSETAGATHVATDQSGQTLVQFNPMAESRLRTKLDWMIVPTVSILYYSASLTEQTSVRNSKIAGLERDLGLTGYDYNTLLSIFYISYVVFEIPSNIMCKWIGSGWFLPTISLGFGVASIATAFVHNFSEATGDRFVLGVFEADMMPGIAYYLSRWYRRSELTFRLSLYIVMALLAGAFGGLLASAILTLDHFGSLTGWHMIFAAEGIITSGLSIISFFTLTDRPETARWLTPQEHELAVARVKSERIATSEVLDKMDKKKLLVDILSPVTVSTSVMFLLNNITVQGLAFFAPTIVRIIYQNETTVMQQLLTVLPYAIGVFFTLLLPLLSWRFDRRQIFMILCTPLVIVGYSMLLGTQNTSVRYAVIFFLSSSLFAVGSLSNSQMSANVVSDTARSSAIWSIVMCGNMGGLISTWNYLLPWDWPKYPIGNGLNLAAVTVTLIIATIMLFWMKRDNKAHRGSNAEEELAGMSQQEVRGHD
ncbi:High-affinity nicotinic acid transporter [Madurella mycetomatis]|uniref:High-affinity nicotinic acid transporter n=1 Tax=Madurella mycetomatis TaxID=100816 RepID=A0A175W3D8_9PEZI|nr:High-affinity nicotinic acid transporter [Madurella mycetomatis]